MSQASESPASRPSPGRPVSSYAPTPDEGLVPATLVPYSGWHFLHLFYRVDRGTLAQMHPAHVVEGREALVRLLDPERTPAIEQRQCFAVPGHKADFGLMLAGPDLKAIHAVQLEIAASPLGPALVPTYSFYSVTEVSEYVPTVDQYGATLRDREGMDPESPAYQAKLAAYARRLEPMNKHRMYPEFPDWPCVCFYPMSKLREGDQNWYLLPFEPRSAMMAEHGRSGMKFAGKVSQVITASTGLDDWEWGVTLWSRNPQYLKDIVYAMRFDESSAKYAKFGDFYFGYILPGPELVETLRLGSGGGMS
jgi:chlorite dismutase